MFIHPHLRAWFESRFQSDRGASLVEYALLLVLIVLVCIAAVTAFGESTASSVSTSTSSLG